MTLYFYYFIIIIINLHKKIKTGLFFSWAFITITIITIIKAIMSRKLKCLKHLKF